VLRWTERRSTRGRARPLIDGADPRVVKRGSRRAALALAIAEGR
jgi:hypothetical protein